MTMTTTILGQRGGAGGESRLPSLTGGATAGPACAPANVVAFTVTLQWPKKGSEYRGKRAAQLAEHLEEQGVMLVAEELGYGALTVQLAVWPAVTARQAQRIAEGVPGYVAGTVEIEP